MNKKKLLLIVQSVLCVVLTVLLAAAALVIYWDGLALKAADPLSRIYSPEKLCQALLGLLPLLLISLVLTVLGLVLGIRDERAEKEPLRPEKAGGIVSQRAHAAEKVPGRLRLLRAALLLAALALIVLGIVNGSAADVFGKAVKICTECVGLG